MASLPSLSSSTSLALVSPPDRGANLMPLMANLVSAAGGSDAALQAEVLKTSQALSTFIEQTNGQLQTTETRNAALEARILASENHQAKQEKMHLAQMQALQNLNATMERIGAQLNTRMDSLDNRLLATNQRIDQLEGKVAPAVQHHQAQVAAAQHQAAAQAAVNQMLSGFPFKL